MKKRAIITVLLVLSLELITYAQSRTSHWLSAETIKNRLDDIEKMYISILSFDQRREAIAQIDNLYNDIVILMGHKTVQIRDNHGFHPAIMPDDVFDLFKKETKAAWPDKEKYKVYLKYVARYNLTIDQLVEIISLTTFDSDKIEAITLIYPSVIDKENSMKLLKAVSNQDALMKSLGL